MVVNNQLYKYLNMHIITTKIFVLFLFRKTGNFSTFSRIIRYFNNGKMLVKIGTGYFIARFHIYKSCHNYSNIIKYIKNMRCAIWIECQFIVFSVTVMKLMQWCVNFFEQCITVDDAFKISAGVNFWHSRLTAN